MAGLDLQSLLKATETLAGEVILERLLEKLIAVCLEVAGARSGALVLAQGGGDGRLQVRARGAVAEPVALERTALGTSPGLPRTLVEHVFSHGEAVVLGDASRHGDFIADPYFASGGVKSALAMPLWRQGRPLGVLYLENNLATRMFTAERVRLLQLLSAQIAIALENSLLFEELTIEVRDRTRAEQAVRFLAEAGAALSESLDYERTLAEVARLAVPFMADWCTVDLVEPRRSCSRWRWPTATPPRRSGCASCAAFPARPARATCRQPRPLRTRAPVLIRRRLRGDAWPRRPSPRDPGAGARDWGRDQRDDPCRWWPAASAGWARSPWARRPERRYGPKDLALAEELARRAALAIDNARLYQAAQEAVRLRDEFLSIASHELNTPIATLRLSVEPLAPDILRCRARPSPGCWPASAARPSGYRSWSGRCWRWPASRRAIVHPQRETIDLGALIRDVTTRLADSLARARCPLTLDLDAAVVGQWDRGALERVLESLLSNASKFGSGKPIQVTLRSAPASARFTVRDEGIGIESGQLPRIFDRFARGVPATHYGGLGLGLYIARALVLSLSGTITVDSSPGQGASFTVTLPR